MSDEPDKTREPGIPFSGRVSHIAYRELGLRAAECGWTLETTVYNVLTAWAIHTQIQREGPPHAAEMLQEGLATGLFSSMPLESVDGPDPRD